MIEVTKLYNQIIFNYYKYSTDELNILLAELEVTVLASYLKRILKDTRNISTIKTILKEYL